MKESFLRDIRQQFRDALKDRYPPGEISSIFHLLTSHYFGFPRTQLAMEPQTTLSPEKTGLLLGALEKLLANIPVQYITGNTLFMDMELQVSRSVLVPRPETEELVRWIIASHKDAGSRRILDIGTGSGCIALGLKKNWGEATLLGMDVSSGALEIARNNAQALQLEVRFRQGDIREPGMDWPAFDLLVSNPPYVPARDRAYMQPHVAESEPPLALFVPDEDPLCFYRDILRFGKRHLKPGGWLYLEIYEAFGKRVCKLLRESGFTDIEIKKDIFGKARFVRGQRPGTPFAEEPAIANKKYSK
ncbi:MAG: peptide chain release factor N(5)-glutamine methyltransferase [Flavobacteriaceae bacterium]|nr:MAG: peptide chain release factor N(5)-glutamine methyltransferase [Flavobacteriaceae bacterium]